MSTRVPTRAREALRRAFYAPARAAASLPSRSLRFKSRRPRYARPGSCVTWRAGASAAEAAGMVERGSRGLRVEGYRWRSGWPGRRTRRARMGRMPEPAQARMARAASPACADASHAGAGSGPASPGKNINPGHRPPPQGLRAKDRQGGGDVHGSTGLRHGETWHAGIGSGQGLGEDLHLIFKYVVRREFKPEQRRIREKATDVA